MNPIGDIVLILHFVVFPALLILLAQWMPFGSGALGTILTIALGLVIVAAFPASAAIMGMTSNIAAAVSPASIRSAAKTMGSDYPLLVLACIGLCALVAVIDGLVMPRLGILSATLALAVELWALLGMFALMGASIWAHRHDFDIGGLRETDEEYVARGREREWRATLDLAYASIRGGLPAEGYATLKKLVADNGHSAEIQYWLVDRMLEWQERRHALGVAARLIEQLVADGRVAEAFELYQRCRRAAPDFAPPGAVAAALGVYAREIGQHGLADELGAGAVVRAAPPPGL
jgi:hypothetical protein